MRSALSSTVAFDNRQSQDRRIPKLSELDFASPYYGPCEISADDSAAVLAKHNIGNRRKRNNLVVYIARQIANGEWQSDHPQPIVFSHLRLIDGQHRLQGIAASGRTVVAMVKTGVRDDLREYIDTGISRQLEDRISLSDDPVENRRFVVLINQWFALMNRNQAKPTPSEAIEMFELHRDALKFASDRMASKQRGVTQAGTMVALAQMYERDKDKAEAFADSLLSPDGVIQPARRLREYLISLHGKLGGGGGAARAILHSKAVGAMRAYLEGRTISLLRGSSWN